MTFCKGGGDIPRYTSSPLRAAWPVPNLSTSLLCELAETFWVIVISKSLHPSRQAALEGLTPQTPSSSEACVTCPQSSLQPAVCLVTLLILRSICLWLVQSLWLSSGCYLCAIPFSILLFPTCLSLNQSVSLGDSIWVR